MATLTSGLRHWHVAEELWHVKLTMCVCVCVQGADFEAAADSYVRKYLTKGVPSLFMDLRPLYG